MIKYIKEKIFNLIIYFFAGLYILRKFLLKGSKGDANKYKIGFIAEEFFHEDLRGFGGYGMTVRNLAEYYNSNGKNIKVEVLMSAILPHKHLGMARYHNSDVIFRPSNSQEYVRNFIKYSKLTNSRDMDLLISIDWSSAYVYPAMSLPKIPLILWIHDPRGKSEWEKIATVPLEMQVIGKDYNSGDLEKILDNKIEAVNKIIDQSKKQGRKIFFATTTPCLVERAKGSYNMAEIDAFVLPIAIDLPDIEGPSYSERPAVLFLARLEPYKRPWVYFELAKRFPHVDFNVAGVAHFPEVMEEVLGKYKDVENLKFLGLVSGKEKHDLLNSSWALVNTSIHEGQPVSFLEALSYYKPIISCHNPDNIVSDHGWFTGDSIGEGLDDKTLDSFTEAIEECITNEVKRREKGLLGRRYVEKNNSLKKFDEILKVNVLEKI